MTICESIACLLSLRNKARADKAIGPTGMVGELNSVDDIDVVPQRL